MKGVLETSYVDEPKAPFCS